MKEIRYRKLIFHTKYTFPIYFIICIGSIVYAQNFNNKNSLYEEAVSFMYSDTEKSLRIADYSVANSNNEHDKINSILLKSHCYLLTNNYKLAATTITEAQKLVDLQSNITDRKTVAIDIARLYRKLELYGKAQSTINKIDSWMDLKENPSLHQFLKTKYLYEKGCLLIQQGYHQEGIKILEEIIQDTQDSKLGIEHLFLICKSYNKLGMAYRLRGDYEKSISNYEKSLQKARQNGFTKYFNLYALSGISQTYLLQSNYQAAGDTLSGLMTIINSHPDISLRKETYQRISEIYLANKDTVKYKITVKKGYALQEEITDSQQKAIDYIFIHSETQQRIKGAQLKSSYYFTIIIIVSAIILAIIIAYINHTKTKMQYAYYKMIIQKLDDAERQSSIPIEKVIQTTAVVKKTIIIPKRTENLILNKLDKFEKSNLFTNKNITLKNLSKDLETNPRYLSEIINKHKNKNFNLYINELRINFIIKKLRSEPQYLTYKISYLADSCGFSSHTSFSTVFSSIIGISPKRFIKFLRKEKK